MDTCWRLPITELARLLGQNALSPVELLQGCLDRCDRLNGRINAIVAFDRAGALEQARQSEKRHRAAARLGPFDGIPVTVKDNLFVKGMGATWGSRLYADFAPSKDDIVVERLRAAGAVIVGKTNTPELALAAHTDNALFGKTRNPWNLSLTPGGSSGGAVAAISAGLVPVAIGTDAGGSIRRPAGYTGIVGFRPSTGRIPRRFGFPALAHDFQVIAPAARTVDEVYALFRAVAGGDSRDPASLAFGSGMLPQTLEAPRTKSLRIRYVAGIGDEPVDPQVTASLERAALQFPELGHDVEPGPAPYDADAVGRIWGTLTSVGAARVVQSHAQGRELVGAAIAATADAGAKVTAVDYVRALDALQALRADVAAAFDSFDVLLTPTSAAMPWSVDETFPKTIDSREAGPRAAAIFATFVNAAGLPAVSIPARPAPDGTPIGLQLVGRFASDVQLLQLARAFELANPWSQRWPAIATKAH